jgi:FtsP/CotA-like multicopper oxidase with cupredoxin domain
VRIRAGAHRFHRDLPESAIWGYDGTVPGPAIEAERGQPVTVQWRNELDGALPVVVTTTAPKATDTSDSCSSLPGLTASCAPARTTSPSARGPELRAQIVGDGQQGPGVAGQQRPVPYP